MCRRWTDRQKLVALKWLQTEIENPSRSDLYSMQIACEVRRVLSKNPNSIKLKDFLLTMTNPSSPQGKASADNIAAVAKAQWRLRLKGKDYTVTHPGKTTKERIRKNRDVRQSQEQVREEITNIPLGSK